MTDVSEEVAVVPVDPLAGDRPATVREVSSLAGPSDQAVYSARYAMLDSWRGVAALAVVVQHVTGLRIGDYAVLLFFVISGYCIAAAATSARRKSLGFRTFMARRIRRIFPPYLLSILFFASTRLVKEALDLGPSRLDRPLLEWIQNLTLTQWVSLLPHPLGNAYDNPVLFVTAYWSLCYEEQFYLVMGLLLVVAAIRGTTLLKPALILGVLAVAWNVRLPALATGFFLEYWIHFLIGVVAFHRLAGSLSVSTRRAADGLVGAVVLGGAAAWAADLGAAPGLRYAYREWVVVGAFYFVIVALRRFDDAYSTSVPGILLAKLGAITYSLYLVHQFNLTACRKAAGLILPAGAPTALNVGLQLVVHVCVAWAFWWLCERPFLNAPLAPASGRREGGRPV